MIHCVTACCDDPKCKAFAVAKSAEPTSKTCTHGAICCFLKDGISPAEPGVGEVAAVRSQAIRRGLWLLDLV